MSACVSCSPSLLAARAAATATPPPPTATPSASTATCRRRSATCPSGSRCPCPDTLWAIFETSTALGRISIRGPESGDWSISDADFELLRSLTTTLGGATADAALTPEASAAVSRLTALARDRHPWTQRLLSGALVDAGAPAKARPNDPLFVLLGTVLGSDDALARNRLVYALTRVEPMTPGAAGLLDVVAKNRGGTALQLAALRADLRLAMGGDASSGGAPGGGGGGDVNRAVQIANAALRRPDGAQPRRRHRGAPARHRRHPR